MLDTGEVRPLEDLLEWAKGCDLRAISTIQNA